VKEEARYLCAFVYELCNIPEPGNDAISLGVAGELVEKFRGVLDFDARQALALTCTAMDRVIRHAEIIGIEPMSTTPAKNDRAIACKNQNPVVEFLFAIQAAIRIFSNTIDFWRFNAGTIYGGRIIF